MLRRRRLLSVHCDKTAQLADPTGGVYRLKTAVHFDFPALLLPPRRRIVRTLSGFRLSTTWTVIPDGFPDVSQKDYLYLPGDARAYLVTGLRSYPRHMEIDLEILN